MGGARRAFVHSAWCVSLEGQQPDPQQRHPSAPRPACRTRAPLRSRALPSPAPHSRSAWPSSGGLGQTGRPRVGCRTHPPRTCASSPPCLPCSWRPGGPSVRAGGCGGERGRGCAAGRAGVGGRGAPPPPQPQLGRLLSPPHPPPASALPARRCCMRRGASWGRAAGGGGAPSRRCPGLGCSTAPAPSPPLSQAARMGVGRCLLLLLGLLARAWG